MDINEVEVGKIYKSGLGFVMAINGLPRDETKFKAVGLSGIYDKGFVIDADPAAFELSKDQNIGIW